MKASDWITLGVVGAVGYGLYQFFGKQGPGGKAADAASSAVADAYVAVTNWLYGSPSVIPTGNVILPNGAKVPIANVQHMMFDETNNVASFVYNGYGYIIRPNPDGGPAYDTNGDYHAE